MQRIHLYFNRSQDVYTDYYYVYRSTTPEVTKQSTRVMKIAQVRTPNPIDIQEVAVRLDDVHYRLSHGFLLTDELFRLFVNGVEAPTSAYQLDVTVGLIRFHQPPLGDDVVEVAYAFDGIEVVDAFGVNGDMDMNYYGPTAADNAVPPSPQYPSIRPTEDGKIQISFLSIDNQGIQFYYAIEARSDNGDFSQLSPTASVSRKADLDAYVIEASRDGLTWIEQGTTQTNSFIDPLADAEPPEGLANAKATKKSVTGGTQITLTWDTPLLNTKYGTTPRYRVRARLTNGQHSQPSVAVGPEYVITPISHIRVLRKQGTVAPVFNDPLAEEVGLITNYNGGQFVDIVPVGTRTYSYSLFVLDEAGNYSIAQTITITT